MTEEKNTAVRDAAIFEKIAGLAKRRGFIYPGSDIYGGLAGTWDYGPLGVELKRALKEWFWKRMVRDRDDVVGLDAAIIMNPKVWEASGHVASFSDPLVECKKCNARFRTDKLDPPFPLHADEVADVPKCPQCGAKDWTPPRQFNLLVEAYMGAIEGAKQKTYLRGEITQGVHVNFKNVVDSTRVKVPFGIAQIGKAFRNEITPGDFTFRSREFEQMELQFYVKPEDEPAMERFEYWKQERMDWYVGLGMKREHLRFHEHAPDERAHYARAAFDIEYQAPDGVWREMEGVHHRGDWDIRRHTEFSGKDLSYFDEETKTRFIPWVIETSGGVDRATLFFLMDAYTEEKLENGEERTFLKLNPILAPFTVAVFPLLANKPQLTERARLIYQTLKTEGFRVTWDDRGNIGKRYRSQDEIGTPFAVTIDFQSLEDNTVTIRDRDSMEQKRILINDIPQMLRSFLKQEEVMR